jgi:hypothetical protein
MATLRLLLALAVALASAAVIAAAPAADASALDAKAAALESADYLDEPITTDEDRALAEEKAKLELEAALQLGCCVNDLAVLEADASDLAAARLDCSRFSPFGAEKCENVLGCRWATGRDCLVAIPVRRCTRVPKYEVHFGQRIDVGQCSGPCISRIGAPPNSCKPRDTVPVQVRGGIVMVVKECECSPCAAQAQNVAIEVPAGVCKGRCAATAQQPRTCTAGVNDNFSGANGPEPSSPSAALLSGPLSTCSAGVQPGFDTFADNRCFGHTFTNCIVSGPCPLRSATLNFCIRAANVFLTNTDSLALGTNAVFHWGIALPTLGGGTWNQGQQLCTTLDLGNLPGGGASILPQIEAAGTLDFFVQDDTAVDFLSLSVDYVDCQVCAPRVSVVSTLYTTNGPQNFVDVRDCGCVDGSDCHREPLFQTLFPGTIFEITLDVGQCIGRCRAGSRCRAVASSKKELKAPEGIRVVEIIEKCDCQ